VAHYRIYDIDRTGRIKNGQDAECDDDAAALLIARSGMNFGTAREVWQGRWRSWDGSLSIFRTLVIQCGHQPDTHRRPTAPVPPYPGHVFLCCRY
jgi:hypothetical protein